MTKQRGNLDDIERSGGNVFADMGLRNAEEALTKAELARQIGRIISGKDWTQAQAAAALGVDQAKVSALLCGRLRGFSTDRLLRFLTALGHSVDIVIRRPEAHAAHGRVHVSFR